ncbi:katanin p80 WD40 repeat-containing subunit B1 homolog KTN80.2-like [Macadamia integrifolia]|uniref:katanin p80 WD40 repeat-containing subunit B1 homolog KTN80.2-like n=1 Tax=Macadamia integrifolia TaxID=60698 RepID=UPI001C527AD5|nr:katanin p80 WD40 repeat-containing subunit B1 homolog KTN80.2-like [Macadamia integrifolia]
MEKCGYKLQEFMAHSSNVNCLNIGKKSCRLVITGGGDHKVKLWAIGKLNSLLSLSGHTSPVESVTFDSAEALVLGGASSGTIKLWDLEEAKIVRTLTGHRSNCTAVEFHPFGEFFVSGSLDTDVKIWDIRKKGCIHTYKGHTRGINTIKFTPDGRWVVSGGLDNVVKIWDLTAGKLLHDFKFHEGQIRCLEFHPLEFLLATGSADRTVKFWDLETFELIGSAGPEETGVRSMTFHPDGRTLFCGLDDSLKVFSWEPIICHGAVDIGWSTLGDLCIHEGKLLGCSYYRNCVGVWVADISLIGPYGGDVPRLNSQMRQKFDIQDTLVQKVGGSLKSNTGLLTMQEDDDAIEIKNIYVDSTNGIPSNLQRSRSTKSPKVVVSRDSEETGHPSAPKIRPAMAVQRRTRSEVTSRPFAVPLVVPRNSPAGENASNYRRESVSSGKTSPDKLVKPTHRRSASSKCDMGHLSLAVESESPTSKKSGSDSVIESPKFSFSFFAKDDVTGTVEASNSTIMHVAEKFEKILSPKTPSVSDQEKCSEALSNNGNNSVKIINGVAVVPGRTRSLVERWEKREICTSSEDLSTNPSNVISEARTPPAVQSGQPQTSGRESTSADSEDLNLVEGLLQNHDIFLSTLRSRLTKLQMVRHCWERNDTKSAINAMGKLPDHSVQADLISVLMEKMGIFTLDLFSCLLPVLTGLLDSKIDRHVSVSLEMILKLVMVFWPVIRSTLSASPSVGVDLHAEHRRDCCNQCFIQLQKIKQVLPSLSRRGGSLTRCAQELHILLQEP